MTTKYQRQWTEFQALKSIYEKEFEEIKFPWKVDHPPWFKVNLKGDIVVEFRMTATYPDTLPEIKVTFKDNAYKNNNNTTITNDHLNELAGKLQREAQSLLGSEMCFDLVELAREACEGFLKRGKTSFHAEMLQTKEERDRKALDQQALQQQRREEQIQAQRKLELADLERKIRDELQLKAQNIPKLNDNSTSSSSSSSSKVITLDTAVSVNTNEEVKTVQVLSNSLQADNWPFGRVLRVNNDGNNTREFDLKVISLAHHPFLQTLGGRRQLEILLKTLKQHPLQEDSYENVLICYGGCIEKDTESDRMFLLYEASNGHSLLSVLSQSGTFSFAKTVGYLKQLLQGLSKLHSTGLPHRALDLNCILLSSNGMTLQITDYLVMRCLKDLSKEHGIVFDDNYLKTWWTEEWQAPELQSRPNFHGKQVDIWSVGRVALQMLFGRDSLKCWPGGFNDFLGSSSSLGLPTPFMNFLLKCFEKDPSKRANADELLLDDSLSIRDIVEPVRAIFEAKTMNITRDTLSSPTLARNSGGNSNTNITNTPSSSRYRSDFEELEFLGRGGFGSVVKVRNKIDDRFYAVKKIALNPRDSEYNKKILREVTTLSRLHHERIIRYYQAWIENDHEGGGVNEEEEETDYDISTDGITVNEEPKTTTIDLSLGPRLLNPFSGLDSTDDFSVSTRKSRLSEDFIEFNGEGSCNSSSSSFTSDTDDWTDEIVEESPPTASKDEVTKSQVLYIQMEYCPNQTLRDLLDERNADSLSHYLDPPEIWRLFRQIVEGLVHIHAQGMMHRDLKPSNIFLDSNGHVKIGDFGLAVTRLESNASARPESPVVTNAPFNHRNEKSFTGESHTQNIGTPFYVSPEQNCGDSAARYNQKVDMYSLGIILVELWVPFQTGMERIQRLRECRLPEFILPPSLEEGVAKIARRLLCHDPKKRFSSLELLKSDLLPPMLEAELIEDALRSVVQPGAPHYPRLINAIFRRQAELDASVVRPKDFAFDVHSGNPADLSYFEDLFRMRRDMERIFVRHGGVELLPPLLYLSLTDSTVNYSGNSYHHHHHVHYKPYTVIDDAGQLLELASNLTRPFARWIAQSMNFEGRSVLKRYAFDRIFRRISPLPGGQPFQPAQVSFDFVHSEDESGLLETCEVVRVAFDGLLATGLVRNDQLTFKFNILQLTSGNKPVKVDESPEVALERMSCASVIVKTQAIKLLEMLKKISIPAKVRVVLDSELQPDLYGNEFCFVIIKDSGRGVAGPPELIIALGGRYNQLIEEYKFPTARLEGKGPFGVGVSLYLDKFLHQSTLKTKTNRKQQQLRTSSTGVILLVPGSIDAFTSEEVWLIGELWRMGRGSVQVSKPGRLNDLTASMIQVQVKSSGRTVRIKWKSHEEVSLEEAPLRLRSILEGEQNDDIDPVEDGSGVMMLNDIMGVDNGGSSSEGTSEIMNFHYVLSTPKSEKNPILREKALKLLKPLLPAKSDILIHELPRDLLRKVIDHHQQQQNNTKKISVSSAHEEFRDQIFRMLQLLQTRLQGKIVALFNHKDGHVELLLNKHFE